MDASVMVLVVISFSFFTLLALAFPDFSITKKNNSHNLMILSSLFMGISLLFLYFDLNLLFKEKVNYFYTFFTFFFLAVSCSFIAKSITDLYGKKSELPYFGNFLFAAFSGFLAVLATFYESYMFRGLSFIFVVMITVTYIIGYLIKNNIPILRNIFFYQSIIIVLFIILDSIRVLIRTEEFYISTADSYDIFFTTLIVSVLITMQTSYLSEIHKEDAKRIENTNQLLLMQIDNTKIISETDTLTGLSNRRKIQEVLKNWITLHNSNEFDFSIIMLDVNDFKKINDTYGHGVGDSALKFVARILTEVTRDYDYVGRWGGDEYIVLLHQASKDNAKIVVRKINDKLKSETCDEIHESVSLSIGFASVEENVSEDSLIDLADKRMYEQKAKYRSEK